MSLDNGRTKMWESLRTDARGFNADIENKLMVLESLSVAMDDPSVMRFEQLQNEVENALKKLHGVTMSMADIVSQLPTGAETHSMQRHTQRYEDIVAEARRSLQRMARENKKRREKHELIHKVHSEITIYNESNEMRELAREQDSLRNTLRRTRELIDEGESSRSRLAHQRAMLLGIGDKVTSITEKVPFVGDILRKIDKKRRRDVVVLSLVIAICLLLIFFFW